MCVTISRVYIYIQKQQREVYFKNTAWSLVASLSGNTGITVPRAKKKETVIVSLHPFVFNEERHQAHFHCERIKRLHH